MVPAAEEEPLKISDVSLPPDIDASLEDAWSCSDTAGQLYPSYSAFRELVLQVSTQQVSWCIL